MGYIITIICIAVPCAILILLLKKLGKKGTPAAIIASFVSIAIIGIVTLFSSYEEVPAGNIGLVYTFGAITGQRPEGLQWIAPWQEVKPVTVQVQGYKFERLESFSKETQDVYIEATINVQVSPKHIQELYREVGEKYFDILVMPRVAQAFKDEIVKYTSVDIAPNREKIRQQVRERLTTELQAYSIDVHDLLINNIKFSEKFQSAIEEKQSQSQLALAEREKVAAETAKAQQEIEKAKGVGDAALVNAQKQAEANKVLNASITPELIQYEFAKKLSPNVSVVMIPNNQPFIFNAETLKQPKHE
jgi:regulator of protease activity HflC (stomatin/prohibitin superfamily)